MTMMPPSICSGEVLALRRTLGGAPDPLAIFAALGDEAARANRLFFETEGRAFILDAAAARVTCRGDEVELVALSDNGRLVIDAVRSRFGSQLVEDGEMRIKLRFPKATGDEPSARLLAPSPFDALREMVFGLKSLSPEEPFSIFAAGAIAFDHVDLVEDLPPAREDPLGFPDYQFWLAESLLVIEPGGTRVICSAFGSGDKEKARRSFHAACGRLERLVGLCSAGAGRMRNLSNVTGPSGPPPEVEPDCDMTDEEFAALVQSLKAHVEAGDVYQVVPSRTFKAPCPDPLAAFAAQRAMDPSPYMFFLSAPDHVLFGASPECAVRVHGKKQPRVEVKPIAGTRARGSGPDEDDRLEADLRLDAKELAEHMMLVDLARNDVARVSAAGTRRVDALLSVVRYAKVMHCVSVVSGELAPGVDALRALVACLNVGTLSGAPKLKATELLRRFERQRRGPYGGALGWLAGSGELDSAVIIRSALVKDGIAHVRAGAGVVHDSVPLAEASETRAKASALLAAIESARQ